MTANICCTQSAADKFIKLNSESPIIAAEWLTSDRRRIATRDDHEDATYLRYHFANGRRLTLHKAAHAAVHAAGYAPVWGA
ncbi:hypothetical protein E6C67_08155 [Azospirillum sp. TSA2s]|uniref:hypothetical protein n=1 Tax=Azospirillum sp. TSA2s TaxID=709810 RepID=UPI0010AB17B8|nr:hypothetical protein [Azospirillum sp. TSA2s]QCG93913.1 hypothetical protein E6C67_08155 [Azospirillum sp. TSA2s]